MEASFTTAVSLTLCVLWLYNLNFLTIDHWPIFLQDCRPRSDFASGLIRPRPLEYSGCSCGHMCFSGFLLHVSSSNLLACSTVKGKYRDSNLYRVKANIFKATWDWASGIWGHLPPNVEGNQMAILHFVYMLKHLIPPIDDVLKWIVLILMQYTIDSRIKANLFADCEGSFCLTHFLPKSKSDRSLPCSFLWLCLCKMWQRFSVYKK